ncbi:MAG: metallophosphoesterase family protein [Candidatus Zixiibacteriota bacterium]|nr:MAG: metallophosphoesterase family protein [candidate division Zixibacteria bacterium]
MTLALRVRFVLCAALLLAARPAAADRPNPGTFLKSEPAVTVAPDGAVQVVVETWDSCTGGQAFLGVRPLDAPLDYPAYRVSGTLSPDDGGRRLTVRLHLKDLEYIRADVNDLAGRGGGSVCLRLQILGERLRVLDRSFAYRRTPDGRYHSAPALAEGPFLDLVSDRGAVVSGAFDVPANFRLTLDPGGRIIAPPTPAQTFELPLDGLEPATRYTYRLTWEAGGGQEFSTPVYAFRTAPAPGAAAPVRFAVLCDSRGNSLGGEYLVEGVSQPALQALLNQAAAAGAEFILFPGDLVSGFTTDPEDMARQLRAWNRATAPIAARIPLYEGMGNHDQTVQWMAEGGKGDYLPRVGEESGEALFARHFVNPVNGPDSAAAGFPTYRENVYSFDWGPAHFVMLNNTWFLKGPGPLAAGEPGLRQGFFRPEQLEWLDRDLAAARARGQEHLFVLAHDPAFPNGGHVQDAMWWKGQDPEILALRDHFWGLLVRHRVAAAFFGHEHNYSRTLVDARVDSAYTHPVWQIVTGGAGAPFYQRDREVPWAGAVQAFYPLSHLSLVEVDGSRVTLSVITPEGAVVERVDLVP